MKFPPTAITHSLLLHSRVKNEQCKIIQKASKCPSQWSFKLYVENKTNSKEQYHLNVYYMRMHILGKYHSKDFQTWTDDSGESGECGFHPEVVCSCGMCEKSGKESFGFGTKGKQSGSSRGCGDEEDNCVQCKAKQSRFNGVGGKMEVVTATLTVIAKRQEMRNSRMTVEVNIVHWKMKGTSNVLAVHMPQDTH